jgi:hypothetical protein
MWGQPPRRPGSGSDRRRSEKGRAEIPPGEVVDLTQKGTLILSVTENGYGKRTPPTNTASPTAPAKA